MRNQLFRVPVITLIVLILLKSDNVFSNPISGDDYVKNELNLKVNQEFFCFPLEVCGVYLSYSQDYDDLKIDSLRLLHFKPNSRTVKEEEKISFSNFKNRYPHIFRKIKFAPPNEFKKLLKKYDVKYIGRVIKTFAPSDTIPKMRINRIGKKIESKSPNYNKFLKIIFPKKYDVLQLKSEFECLSFVSSVELNQIIKYDNIKGPKLIQKVNPNLPDSLMNKVLNETVVITVSVVKDGSIAKVQVFISANSLLDSLSLDAARRCRFEPGMRNGKPIQMKYNIPFKF